MKALFGGFLKKPILKMDVVGGSRVHLDHKNRERYIFPQLIFGNYLSIYCIGSACTVPPMAVHVPCHQWQCMYRATNVPLLSLDEGGWDQSCPNVFGLLEFFTKPLNITPQCPFILKYIHPVS